MNAKAAGYQGNEFWKELNSIFNFFKHAGDKDGGEREVLDYEPTHEDIDDLIFFTITILHDLGAVSNEMKVFHDWKLLSLGRRDQCRFTILPNELQNWPIDKQLAWCRERCARSRQS
jgi:hypothetical protein